MPRAAAHDSMPHDLFIQYVKGIACDTHPSAKDEAPMACKDLTEVMENQKDLTEISCRLFPLVNVKGFEKKIPKKYCRGKKKY